MKAAVCSQFGDVRQTAKSLSVEEVEIKKLASITPQDTVLARNLAFTLTDVRSNARLCPTRPHFR